MQASLIAVAAALSLVAAGALAQPAKPAPKKAAAHNAHKSGKHGLARSAQKAVEEVTPIDDEPGLQLGQAELDVAKRVFVGEIPCELGATVRITPARRDGLFVVTTKGYRFVMHPVESRTGAIRLEDSRRGAMWLQLGNKSMLMSQKLGQRLADECQSPQQKTVAEDLKAHPRPSILEPLPAAAAASAPADAASVPAAAASAPSQAASASASVPVPAASATPAVSLPAGTATTATTAPTTPATPQ